MDPHTHDHNKQLIINNTSNWGTEGSSAGIGLVENMVYMDHNQQSHMFFHDHKKQHHADLPASSLDNHHHSPIWQSCTSTDHVDTVDYNNVPFSHPSHLILSPRPASSATNSLRFVGSSYAAHHHVGVTTYNHQHQYQVITLDHQFFSQVLHKQQEDEHEQHDDQEHADNSKDDPAGFDVNRPEDEGLDHEVVDEDELSAMKEMMYKIAAMQPVDIDPSTIFKPKRRNVRISDDPQSVAARHRRERISEKMRILQRLVPGGTKMDTASMLDEAIRYVKFLKRTVKHLQKEQTHPLDQLLLPASLKSSSILDSTTSPLFNHQYLAVTMANKKHQQQQQLVRFVAAAASPPIATHDDPNCGTVNFNSALVHRHDNHQEAENPSDILNICTSSNSKVHHCSTYGQEFGRQPDSSTDGYIYSADKSVDSSKGAQGAHVEL